MSLRELLSIDDGKALDINGNKIKNLAKNLFAYIQYHRVAATTHNLPSNFAEDKLAIVTLIRDLPDVADVAAVDTLISSLSRAQPKPAPSNPQNKREKFLNAIQNELANCSSEELTFLRSARGGPYNSGTFEINFRSPPAHHAWNNKNMAAIAKNRSYFGVELSEDDIKNLDIKIEETQRRKLWLALDDELKFKLDAYSVDNLKAILSAAEAATAKGVQAPTFEEKLAQINHPRITALVNEYDEIHLAQGAITNLIKVIKHAQSIKMNQDDLIERTSEELEAISDAELSDAELLENEILETIPKLTKEELKEIEDAVWESFKHNERANYKLGVFESRINDLEIETLKDILKKYAGTQLTYEGIERLVMPFYISLAIKNLSNNPNDFKVLNDIISTNANPGTIRKILFQTHIMQALADLSGLYDIKDYMFTDAGARIIAKMAEVKRAELISDLQDEKRNAYQIQFALTAITDLNDNALNAIANIRIQDPDNLSGSECNAIRQVLQDYSHELGGIDLTGKIGTEEIITNDDAVNILHAAAVQTRSKLRKEYLKSLVKNTQDDEQNNLSPLINAANPDDIRSVLNNNPALGNLAITNANDLTDEDALNVRRTAINRHHALSGRPEPQHLKIPEMGTQEYTDLIRHIELNLPTYTDRISQLGGAYTANVSGLWKKIRHSEGTVKDKKVDLDKLSASCLNMRDQLVFYKSYLEMKDAAPEISATVTANIAKLDLLLKKIDDKYEKEVKTFLYYGTNAEVVPLENNQKIEEIKNNFLAGQKGPAKGRIEGELYPTTEKFGPAARKFARVNHVAIRTKNKTAHLVSIQRVKENNQYVSEFYFDPNKLDLSRNRFANIPNDGVMKWAVTVINDYLIPGINLEKGIRIVGDMPRECANALALYCAYRGHECINATGHSLNITPEKQTELEIRFEKAANYITGGRPELAVRHTKVLQQEKITEVGAVNKSTPGKKQ
ncbi:MAG: hypothetical protein JO149_08020 [Gammaproteobacteria bacterium]|nr:hypothetical protein [Gammaproteobacteria bacterium]